MSTMLMGLCWPLKMAATLKAVLISLADNANDQGYCWPSIATICERTCLSERTVRNALRDLERIGLLETAIGAMKSNRYIIHARAYVARLEAARLAEEAAAAAAKAAESGPVSERSGGHHVPGGTTCPGAPRAGEGGTTCPLTVIEPNTNTPPTPQSLGGQQGSSSEASSDDRAAVDWDAVQTSAGLEGGGRSNSVKAGPVSLSTWLASCAAKREKPIPAGDKVFDYCAAVGISTELLGLCWREFKHRHSTVAKRQRDWRQKFRNCVQQNWYGLWYLPSGEAARLSSKGEQAQRFFAAQDAEQDAGQGGAA